MSATGTRPEPDLAQRLAEAEATIAALLSGQIDAVVDARTQTPVLLSNAQAALRDSEERYRRIVETASEGILTVDRDANVDFVNRRIADMLGEDPAAMLGRPLLQFLPPDRHAEAIARLARSRLGQSDTQEVRLRRRDSVELWVLLKTSPIRDADGGYLGTLAMMTDRTQQRHDEEARRHSEQQYRQIVETTTDGILKNDVEGRIVFVNARFAELVGYQPFELLGRSVFELMSPATRVTAEPEFWRRRRAAIAFDTSFRHHDGTAISVNIARSPLLDAAGQYAGNLGIVRDVTEQKKLQSQLMVSDRMASVGTLAAGIAHEINNPLAAVLANLEHIADQLVRAKESGSWTLEEISAPLADAREAAMRVRFIVRDLRIFSRSPGDDPSGPVDVKATMESALRMAWHELRHRAQLIKQYGTVPPVQANEARLGQVFVNLVVNAAQALDAGRAAENQITVTTRVDGARVVVEVSDTGAGIPPENLTRIFDAFFTTKPVGVGTGLGLAICHRIVTDMGGELTVTSQPGIGTTFRVAIPVASSEAPIAAPVAPAVQAGRRGRILVVDDEELVVRSIKRVLSNDHDVVTVVAAREALTRCQAGERFDLILCDLMMPDMTGMDLHRELLREVPDQADRMIFLTGGAFTAAARSFLSEAPKEHLEKPFDPANLRAIVRRYLR